MVRRIGSREIRRGGGVVPRSCDFRWTSSVAHHHLEGVVSRCVTSLAWHFVARSVYGVRERPLGPSSLLEAVSVYPLKRKMAARRARAQSQAHSTFAALSEKIQVLDQRLQMVDNRLDIMQGMLMEIHWHCVGQFQGWAPPGLAHTAGIIEHCHEDRQTHPHGRGIRATVEQNPGDCGADKGAVEDNDEKDVVEELVQQNTNKNLEVFEVIDDEFEPGSLEEMNEHDSTCQICGLRGTNLLPCDVQGCVTDSRRGRNCFFHKECLIKKPPDYEICKFCDDEGWEPHTEEDTDSEEERARHRAHLKAQKKLKKKVAEKIKSQQVHEDKVSSSST